LVTAGGSAAVVFGILGQPVPLVISLVVAVAGVVIPVVIAFGLAVAEARHEDFEFNNRLLVPVSPVSKVNPLEIGVDRAAREETHLDTDLPEYMRRNADRELREALKQAADGSGRWIVVVDGLPKVGKSRTLFEGLLHLHSNGGDVRLIVPRDGEAVGSLLEEFRAPWPRRIGFRRKRQYVLWLDDLEDFAADGVGIKALQAWRRKGAVVVATYGGKGSQRNFGANADRVSDLSAGVMRQARKIGLQATTPEELRNLPAQLSAVDQQALARYGLAATLVAGPELVVKLNSQQHDGGGPKSPVGAAIVYTAINWERCGRSDPIAKQLLRELWPDHIWPADMKDHVATMDEDFERGLAWALQPVAGQISLLRGVDSFEAYGYVRRAVSDKRELPAISGRLWRRALDTDDPRQALGVGIAALAIGRTIDAKRALELAASEGDQEIAAAAKFNLGVLLRKGGKAEEAEAAFEQGAELGNPDAIDVVLNEYAGPDEEQRAAIERQFREEGLLEDGEIVWREDVYRKEIEEGNGASAADLGLMLWGRGDRAEARDAFEKAIALGFFPAAVELGVLLEQMDEPNGAEAAYQQAMERDLPEGAFNLGVLRKDRGDIAGSELALRRAAQLGHGQGASNLGVLLAERGDLAGAETAYRQAAEAGVPQGAFNLGKLLEMEGRVEEAEVCYRLPATQGNLDAAVRLARLLLRREEHKAAREALVPAARAGGTDEVLLLAVILEEDEDLEQAEHAYREAMERGIGVAGFYLGRLLERQGRQQEAEEAYAAGDRLEAEAAAEEEPPSED
jgi:tetratricopeptide (TPR) repeat protein